MEKQNLTKQDIIEKIALLRTEKNISAYKLSMALGHSKTYMYRVENGEIDLSIDTFLEILDVLGVTTAEFFCPENSQTKKEAKEPLLELIEKLPEETKSALLSFIIKLKA